MTGFRRPLRRTLRAFATVALVAVGATVTGAGSAAASGPVVPKAVVLNTALQSPWGLAFLPDGRMLVTEKAGRLLILSADGARVETVVGGLPRIGVVGQGGLLDVALDPDFASEPWVYLAYVESGTGAEADLHGTVVARGRLAGDTLREVSVIYRQVPKVPGALHFGARLVFAPDRTLFATFGDRQQPRLVQDPTSTLGKVVRIARDGSVPADNPRWPGGRPEIFSLGHRNVQGAAIRPGTGELWIHEHGAQGGDELNRVVAGGNYGWPRVSYGCRYGDPPGEACRIGGGVHAPDYVEPVSWWGPRSIAPSGMVFYSGDRFPAWRGHVLLGALAGTALWRVQLEGHREVARERLLADLGERIRDVRQGPDGWVYLLTDSGKLVQLRD